MPHPPFESRLRLSGFPRPRQKESLHLCDAFLAESFDLESLFKTLNRATLARESFMDPDLAKDSARRVAKGAKLSFCEGEKSTQSQSRFKRRMRHSIWDFRSGQDRVGLPGNHENADVVRLKTA